MGVILQQLVPVFGMDAHEIEILVRRLFVVDVPVVNIEKKFQKFPSGHEFRYGGCGQDVADVLGKCIPGCAVFGEIEPTGIKLDVPVEAVEQRGFARTVAAKKTVDLAGSKGEVYITKDLLPFIVLR